MSDNNSQDSQHSTQGRSTNTLATSRRRFITAVAATGTGIGVGGAAIAQEGGSTTFELGGETSGWVGRAPSSIGGQTNPTLELIPGTDYAITWENVDGQPHNVVILDADENQLERTEIISEEGATQTLEFTATEAMAEYLCEVHPTSMRGSISLGTAPMETQTPTNETSNETDTSNETERAQAPDPDQVSQNASNESAMATETPKNETKPVFDRPTPAETPAQTFELVFENSTWTGRSPSSIAGETNPTLELEAGETYRVTWENRVSVSDPSNQRPNFVVYTSLIPRNDVVRTEYVSEKGETQSVDFVATTDLVSYGAEAYLDARGEISVAGTENQQQGNGKAKTGNGKAKSGNGKAKTGNGSQNE